MLPNPYSWMFEKTYDELGINNKDNKTIREKFSQSSDNYINFLEKDNNMFVSTMK